MLTNNSCPAASSKNEKDVGAPYISKEIGNYYYCLYVIKYFLPLFYYHSATLPPIYWHSKYCVRRTPSKNIYTF